MILLPRCLNLAVWADAVRRDVASPDDALSALGADDEEHVVTVCDGQDGTKITSAAPGVDPSPRDLPELIHWVARSTAVSVVLPAAGDPFGLVGPPPAVAAAIDSGEALVVDHSGLWTLTVLEKTFGSPWEPGRLVTWCLYPAPADIDTIPFNDPVPTQRELRQAILQASETLTALDVAGARPATRTAWGQSVDGELLDHVPLRTTSAPPRTVDSLALALRLRHAIALALADGGTPITTQEVVHRERLLRSLDAVCRRTASACGTALVDPASEH